MNGKTKPAAGTAGQGKNGAGQSVRHLDYTILNVLRQLPQGKRMSMADLAAERGCTERELRRRIEALRRAGYPILSSTAKGESGYWLGDSPQAIEQWVGRTVQRAIGTIRQAQAVVEVVQPALFEV